MELEHVSMLEGLYPYLQGLSGAQSELMAEMEEYGRRRRFPLVGPLVGRFLMQIAILMGARRILEIGSGYGYSAAWFLQAHPEVRIKCIDGSELNRERGLQFLSRLGVADRVDFEVGDALAIASVADGPFDLIFCDMDKNAYSQAFRATFSKLRQGGAFIADNVLWRGFAWFPVPDDAPEFRKKMTPGIREFNQLTHHSPGVITSIIPLRDGLSISVKL